jgi:hypothetical protein
MNVYFFQRKTLRKRQRETVEFCPSEITPIVSPGINFIKDTKLSGPQKLSLRSKLRYAAVKLLPINCRPIDRKAAANADIVYTWGCFPLFSSKPYVIEMDNPYCICFYNFNFFKFLKPILRKILLSKK